MNGKQHRGKITFLNNNSELNYIGRGRQLKFLMSFLQQLSPLPCSSQVPIPQINGDGEKYPESQEGIKLVQVLLPEILHVMFVFHINDHFTIFLQLSTIKFIRLCPEPT